MAKQLKIRDLSLRDGQQSQFATRMNQTQVDRVLPLYSMANFYAMEVWGGAVPDSIMRYLGENPWSRLESIKAAIGKTSLLTALSRGRNLFGYTPYPDSLIKGFCTQSVQSGIDIMRIFDALNDLGNITSSISFVKDAGGIADCAICYTTDPQFSTSYRFKSLLSGNTLPHKLFSIKYFVEMAKKLEKMGAEIITIKDMAGLLEPKPCYDLVLALKNEISLPINLHTHSTPGYSLASMLMAMVAGVDIVDTVVLSWSGGPSHPAYEIIQLFADRLGLETGVNKAVVAAIDTQLRIIRIELASYDQYKSCHPPILDLSCHSLPPEDEALFDAALEAALKKKIDKVLEICQKIEQRFNYPPPDDIVKKAQIPGGMYTNMLAQLKDLQQENLVDEVLKLIPKVRLDCGIPPLVTPTSQIVGAQAVNCVIAKNQGKDLYTNVSKNFFELVKGSYGKTPWPINPKFRERICGTKLETELDLTSYKLQDNPILSELDNTPLAINEKEELLLNLFPSVATTFLKKLRQQEFDLSHPPPLPIPEKPSPYSDSFWMELLPENAWA